MGNEFLIGLGVCFSSKINLDYFVKLDLCGVSSLPVEAPGELFVFVRGCVCL